MKKIVRKLFGAAVALGLVSAAHAADPVAVWDGFTSLTSGDYTWTKSTGTTVSEGVVTIGSDGGLTLPISSGSIYTGRTLTIIVDAEVPSFASTETPLIDFYVNANCVTLTGDGSTLRQRWNYGGNYGSSAWTPGRQKIAVVFKGVSGASDRGTATYIDGVSKIALVNGLMTGSGNLNKISIGCYAKDSTKLAANMKVYRVALFDSNISAADVAAYKFPSEILAYTATLSSDKALSELEWTPAKPAGGFTDGSELTINNTSAAKLTLDTALTAKDIKIVNAAGAAITLVPGASVTAAWDFSEAAGGVTIDASGLSGTDLAKNAVVGAPYSYWTGIKGSVTGTPTVTSPTMPTDYTVKSEVVSGFGVRLVVTAPSFAKLGAVNLNLHNGTALSGDGNHGLYPVALAGWGNLQVANNGSTTLDGLTFTLSSSVGGYGVNNTPPDMIQKQYMDDNNNGVTRTLTVSGMAAKGYAKYRAIVYFSTDSANITFAPLSVTAGGATTHYAGPTAGSTTAGYTVKGSDNTWGHTGANHNANALGEGVNALVTDVMTADSITLNFLKKNGQRATPCAVQVVQVGEVVYEPKNYTAEISSAVNLSEIVWTPAKTQPFGLSDTLTVTVSGNATLTFDADAPVEKLTVVSAAGTDLTLAKGDVTLTLPVYDFSGAAGKTTVSYDPGSASVKAGADTVLDTVSAAALTIAADKKVTVKSGSLTASKVSNSGTLNFDGGTAESPISVTGDANLGAVTLAANTYVKNDDKGGNRKHQVTGAGASSFYELTRNNGGSAGMAADTTFNNVILVSGAVGNNAMWLERAAMTDAGLDAKGTIKINDLSPTVRSLTGGGIVGKNGTATLTIACSEDANYSGASDLAFTIAAGSALQTLSGAYTGALTVNEGAQVKLSGSAAPASVSNAGTVILDFGVGTTNLLNASSKYNGTLEVASGVAVVFDGFSGSATATGSGEVFRGYTVSINDNGKFTVPSGVDPANVKLFTSAGVEVAISSVEGQVVSFDFPKYGKSCKMEYLFKGSLASTGSDTGAMQFDGTHCFSGYEYVTNAAGEKVGGIYAASAPWRNVTFPSEVTVVMYGKVMKTSNACQIGIGSTTAGSKYSLFLASGDVSKEEVVLGYAYTTTCYQDPSKFGVLCRMTVPHAQTMDHLYAFTLTQQGEKTLVKIYLDGELLQPYEFATTVTLGGGIQLGSIHGGVGGNQDWPDAFGFKRSTAVETEATLKFLRVYDVVLNDTVMREIAKDNPYVSPNGSYQRDVAGEAAWSSADAWTIEGTEPAETADVPAEGATAKLNATSAATVGVNLAADATYEAVQLTGADIAFVQAPGATGKAKSTGRVTADANVTFDYNAFVLPGAPLTVKQGKKVTFDLSNVDMTQFFTSQTYDLTGYVTMEEGAEITNTPPAELHGREISASIDPLTKHYIVTVTAPVRPFTYTDGTWTWGTQVVTPEAVSNNTGMAIIVNGGTLEWPIDRSSFTVNGGTLKATQTGTATIMVNGGAFDMNGTGDGWYTIVLAGGALVNDGAAISNDSRQIASLSLTADSTVGGTAAFGYISSGLAANTLDLGGYTLTKTGTNTFALCNTTVSNGTLKVTGGTLDLTRRASVIDNTADLSVGANGTLQTSVNMTFADPTKWSKISGAVVVANGTLQLGNNNCQVSPSVYSFGDSITVASGATLTLKLGTSGNYAVAETVFYNFATDIVLDGGTLNSPDGGYRYSKITVNTDSLFAPRWDKHHFISDLSGSAKLTLDANYVSLFAIESGDFTGTIKANTSHVRLRPEGTALANATVELTKGEMILNRNASVGTLLSPDRPISGTGTLTLGDGSMIGGVIGGELSLSVVGEVALVGVNTYTGTTLIRDGGRLDAQLGAGLPVGSLTTIEAGGKLVVDMEEFATLAKTTAAYSFSGKLPANALEIVNGEKYPWLSVGTDGENLGKIVVDQAKLPFRGLHIVKMMPKATSRIADRDPNGRESGWIDLVNYGPETIDLADYKIVRSNIGKKVKNADKDFGRLCPMELAAGDTIRVYTSEDYETAEDYGGDGKTVAWFKTVDGVVTKLDDFEDGAIMVVPAKVNPKKYPMVRLYDFTTDTANGVVADEVIVPCDIDDNMQVALGLTTNKLERSVVYADGTKVPYGPDVASLYGVKDVQGDLALMKPDGFAPANAAYPVVFPVNPFMTNGTALPSNEIESVKLVYRVFAASGETTELEVPTEKSVVAKGAENEGTYGKGCRLWSGEIPAEAMATPGALVQFRAKITDKSGDVWYAPRNLNPDIGYEWYGVVVQPAMAESVSADDLASTAVCTNRLQTFLMFGCGDNLAEMDKDIDAQDLTKVPYGARVAIYDTQTHTYYDNVRIDLRGQTSRSFYKKSHGLRFSKVAPLACVNPFYGDKVEVRKTSFIAEYGDPTYLRQTLALRVMRESGVKAPFDYPVRVYLNGTFYQLAFHSNRFTDELVEDYYKLEAKAGCAYKNVHQLTTNCGAEKKTPDDDNESDLSVLNAYAARIQNETDQAALAKIAMTNFNIAAWVNYLAATRVTQEADDIWTNMGIYINKFDAFHNPNGDDTMMPLAYDQNLSWGQWYYADDANYGRMGIVATNDLMKSHPFYGGREILFHNKNGSTKDMFNRGVEVILKQEAFRNMLSRRIRTLAEKYLGALDAEKADTPVWQWAMTYKAAIADDVAADRTKWEYSTRVINSTSNIWVWPTALGFEEAFDDLWENYIVPRRRHLYDTHAAANAGQPGYPTAVGYATGASAGIPGTQAPTAELRAAISIVDVNGRAAFAPGFRRTNGIIAICNSSEVAIDASGWKLAGLVNATLKPGTVIPANGCVWVVADRQAAAVALASASTENPAIVGLDKAAGEAFDRAAITLTLSDANGTTAARYRAPATLLILR